jgi:hypothetical protein
MPTKPNLYTAVGEAMMDTQKKAHHCHFLWLFAECMEHRHKDWMEARVYYD